MSGSLGRFNLDALITVEELAARLRVSLKTIRSWIYLRKIPFTKLGRRVYFSVGIVEKMLNRNAVPACIGQRGPDGCPVENPIPTQAEEGGVNDNKENLKNG